MNRTIFTTPRLLVIGAVHLDDIAIPLYPLVPEASNPVNWTQRLGGVAANAACAAARTLNHTTNDHVHLMAAVGNDATALLLKQALNGAGVETRLVEFPATATGRYTAIMTDKGDLHIGLADVSLAERLGESCEHEVVELSSYNAVLVDANLSENYLKTITGQAATLDISLAAMSVSPAKSQRLISMAKQIDVLFCNRREALSMNPQFSANATLEQLADGLCHIGFTRFVLTDASSSLLVQDTCCRVRLNVPKVQSIHNVNGAGDALAGASFAAFSHGIPLAQAVQEAGLVQAAMVVTGEQTAPPIQSAISN